METFSNAKTHNYQIFSKDFVQSFQKNSHMTFMGFLHNSRGISSGFFVCHITFTGFPLSSLENSFRVSTGFPHDIHKNPSIPVKFPIHVQTICSLFLQYFLNTCIVLQHKIQRFPSIGTGNPEFS